MDQFEQNIDALDPGLFAAIPAQLTNADRISLLAIQKAVRQEIPGYVYLEIGSHLGGSLQPHLLDPRCAHLYSIDKRPALQPDDRGMPFAYPENSTAHMLDLLRHIEPGKVDSIRCFDSDASMVDPSAITPRPHLCLIDGEHTEQAALSDFSFCRTIIDERGIILFHDANVIYTALARIVQDLEKARMPFHAYVLPSSIFVIELGNLAAHRAGDVTRLLLDNHAAYLYGLLSLDHYREVYNRPGLRVLRSLWHAVLRLRRMFGKGGGAA